MTDDLITDLTDDMIREAMRDCGIAEMTGDERDDLRAEVEAQSGGDYLPRSWWEKEARSQVQRIIKNRSAPVPTDDPPEVAVTTDPRWMHRVAPPVWAFVVLVAWQVVLSTGLAWVVLR